MKDSEKLARLLHATRVEGIKDALEAIKTSNNGSGTVTKDNLTMLEEKVATAYEDLPEVQIGLLEHNAENMLKGMVNYG